MQVLRALSDQRTNSSYRKTDGKSCLLRLSRLKMSTRATLTILCALFSSSILYLARKSLYCHRVQKSGTKLYPAWRNSAIKQEYNTHTHTHIKYNILCYHLLFNTIKKTFYVQIYRSFGSHVTGSNCISLNHSKKKGSSRHLGISGKTSFKIEP